MDEYRLCQIICSNLFKDTTNICIAIAIASIILTNILSLSIVRPSYSIDNFTLTNRNNSNSNSSNNKISPISVQSYDKLKNCAADQHTPTNAITYLTHFSCGHVTILKNVTTLRQFTIIAKENVKVPISNTGLTFSAWTYNGSIPGPTMRMTEGDHVRSH